MDVTLLQIRTISYYEKDFVVALAGISTRGITTGETGFVVVMLRVGVTNVC